MRFISLFFTYLREDLGGSRAAAICFTEKLASLTIPDNDMIFCRELGIRGEEVFLVLSGASIMRRGGNFLANGLISF